MRSVRVVFILSSFVMMVILSIFLTVLSYTTTRDVVTKNVEDRLESATKLGIANIEGWINSHIAQVEEMAASSEIRSLQSSRVNAYLSEKLAKYADYSSFWLSDMNGDWYSPLGTSGSIAQREYFPRVISSRQTVISNPLIGQADGSLTVVLAIPVFVDGQMRAVLGANVRVSKLVEEVNDISIGTQGYAALYEASGLTIIDRDASKTLKYNPFDDSTHPFSRMRGELMQSGRISRTQFEGKSVFLYSQKLGITDWMMTSIAMTDEFMAPLSSAFVVNVVGTVIIIAIALLLVWTLAVRITRPLGSFNHVIESMSGGDMTVGTGITGRGAFAGIARSLDDLRGELRAIIVGARESVEQVSEGTHRIAKETKVVSELAKETAAGSQDILDNSRNNASSAETISNVISGIANSINQVGDNMESISTSAGKAVALADEGSGDVRSVVEQMSKIQRAVQSASSIIAEVSESSRSITEIVDTIAGISKQTNLLSVNASIEAARAGEQGRGFAVVAGEVGKLASQSSEATERISALAMQMQENTERAIQSIEAGTHEVGVGTDVVRSAGRAFSCIQELVRSLLSQLDGIKDGIDEISSQKQGLVEVSDGIQAAAERNTRRSEKAVAAMDEQQALVLEMLADVEKLTKNSEKLSEDIEQFKI